jgi:hypothetical protein
LSFNPITKCSVINENIKLSLPLKYLNKYLVGWVQSLLVLTDVNVINHF